MKDKKQIDELKIKKALEYSNAIIATLREPFLVLDKNLRVISANQAFYTVFKVAEKDTIGRPLPDLGDGQWNIPKLLQLLKEIIPEKKVVKDYEVEHQFEQIGQRVMILNVCQLRVSKKIAAIVGGAIEEEEEELVLLAIEDITERKKAYDELKETREKLFRFEKLATLGKLAGIVSHELRNPLGAIRNSVYFLRLKLDPSLQDEKIKRHLEIMDQEISNSDRIINDVLFFSRVKQLIITQNNLNEILKAALKKVITSPNIKVDTDLAELPLIPSDEGQLVQVFINIILNAVESMPKGGKLAISSSVKQDRDFINVSIKDTGEGISKENLLKLFEPLFSTKINGTGLGMVVCKGIIENHKGYIKVESKEDKGTLVTVGLPIKQT